MVYSPSVYSANREESQQLIIMAQVWQIVLFFKKGLNHLSRAKINYFNKIGNDENFKLHSKQYKKYIKCLQSRIRNKYSLYTAKYITKYIKKVGSSPPKTKQRNLQKTPETKATKIAL